MSEKISADATNIIKKTFKVFGNLLKEFPRSATEDFIYDENTIEKISNAEDTLKEMSGFIKKKSASLGKEEKNMVKDSFGILARLMDELPKDPSDEFLYDRVIHQLVEQARVVIVNLGQFFP
jgi:hypothetical protein